MLPVFFFAVNDRLYKQMDVCSQVSKTTVIVREQQRPWQSHQNPIIKKFFVEIPTSVFRFHCGMIATGNHRYFDSLRGAPLLGMTW